MYGKVMSIPDELIMPYFELITDVPDDELAAVKGQLEEHSVNPMLLKKRLAREIVAQFHSAEAAQEGEAHFEGVFQKRGMPEDMPEHPLPSVARGGLLSVRELEVLLVEAKVAESRAEARRLIQQRAVEIDGKKVTEEDMALGEGSVIKVGKRRFLRLVKAR
jgi:tyrosyl-tRNA synthetase